MIVCVWPMWCEMAIKRLMTVVSVSLSSAGAWIMGSIHTIVIGGLMTLAASFIALKEGAECVSVMCGLIYMYRYI